MEELRGLSTSQREAVTSTEGFIRVIAGAGSGKTRALSHRFAFLVNEIGVLPSNILCVTFTNKAANEMRSRIRQLTRDNDTGYISTFHSFCVSVLQEDSHAVQYPESFLVLDNSDIDSMLQIIYSERNLTLRDKTFKDARDMFEMRKCKFEPEYYRDMIAMPIDLLRQKYMKAEKVDDILFYGYLYQQKKCFGLDYNDLIKFVLYIFESSEEIKLKWQKRLEYIMIDEFQDIDDLQYRLMAVLCDYHKNLFVVGDPDQTIYTWRGANIRYLLDFDKNFPNTRTIMMMENYRSTESVLNAANSLISKNVNRMKKDLLPTLDVGEKPTWHHAGNAREEAEWVAGKVLELEKSGVQPSDITILYRSHFVTRTFEEVFLKKEIPYMLYSGVQFYNRAEIKDVLSYLRLIAFRDDLSFARIVNQPKRNIGEQRMRFLREYAEKNNCLLIDALAQTVDQEIFRRTGARKFLDMMADFEKRCHDMTISELVAAVMEESGYEEALRTEGSQERLDNLAELRQSIYEYETTCGEEALLSDYLNHVALFSNADTAASKMAVKFMTVHTAKGLEFPHIFLVSMEEGVFPAKKTATREAMEEERRLAFVAVTRAERGLYFTDSEGRNLDGSFRYPSRFILEIDKRYVDWENEPAPDLVKKAWRDISWSEDYLRSMAEEKLPEGTRIIHGVFGEGSILRYIEERNAYEIKFDAHETSRLISARVKLTCI